MNINYNRIKVPNFGKISNYSKIQTSIPKNNTY